MDVTGSRLCPAVRFGASSVELRIILREKQQFSHFVSCFCSLSTAGVELVQDMNVTVRLRICCTKRMYKAVNRNACVLAARRKNQFIPNYSVSYLNYRCHYVKNIGPARKDSRLSYVEICGRLLTSHCTLNAMHETGLMYITLIIS